MLFLLKKTKKKRFFFKQSLFFNPGPRGVFVVKGMKGFFAGVNIELSPVLQPCRHSVKLCALATRAF